MRSPVLAFVLLAGAGCGATTPRPIQRIGAPEVYAARVIASRGPLIPQRGDACTIEVEHTDDRFYNCRIRIECSGDIVYGLADGGYNACYVRDAQLVFARDRNGTRIDGDPRLYFDVSSGRAYVSDDEPDVELEMDLSGLPERYDGEETAVPEPGA